MVEVSIWTLDNKPLVKGVDNCKYIVKLLPQPVFDFYSTWLNCSVYGDKDEYLLESVEIRFRDLIYRFDDLYWD